MSRRASWILWGPRRSSASWRGLKARGTTIVIVENDPDQVAPLADRMLLLREGKERSRAAPRVLRHRPGRPEDSVPPSDDLYLALQQRLGLTGPVSITLEEGIQSLGALYRQHARH